jgi:hypothetical protein
MRILFIGNSHTFYNAMPFQVRQILRGAGTPCDVQMIATGGMTLGWHAEQPATIAALSLGEFSCVVLQQKAHPFDGARALSDDLTKLAPALEASGARIVLYGVWPEKDRPENRKVLDDALRGAAADRGLGLAPVSAAWAHLGREHPEVELYDGDCEHASPLGSYVAACVLARVLGQVERFPARIETRGRVLTDVAPGDVVMVERAVAAALSGGA